MAKKARFTNRERVLHEALAIAAWHALKQEDVERLTGKEGPFQTDLISAVASMSQRQIHMLQVQIIQRQRDHINGHKEMLHRARVLEATGVDDDG